MKLKTHFVFCLMIHMPMHAMLKHFFLEKLFFKKNEFYDQEWSKHIQYRNYAPFNAGLKLVCDELQQAINKSDLETVSILTKKFPDFAYGFLYVINDFNGLQRTAAFNAFYEASRTKPLMKIVIDH